MMIASEVPTQSWHAHVVGDAHDAEDLVQHRHDHPAPADAEQAGQHAGQRAARDNERGEHGELARGKAEHVRGLRFLRG